MYTTLFSDRVGRLAAYGVINSTGYSNREYITFVLYMRSNFVFSCFASDFNRRQLRTANILLESSGESQLPHQCCQPTSSKAVLQTAMASSILECNLEPSSHSYSQAPNITNAFAVLISDPKSSTGCRLCQPTYKQRRR